jgi:hypothetical protein
MPPFFGTPGLDASGAGILMTFSSAAAEISFKT